MDTMMDLWSEIENEQRPSSSHSSLATPRTHFDLNSEQPMSVLKTPRDVIFEMEDSGYSSSCASSSSVELSTDRLRFKTPRCPIDFKLSWTNQKIFREVPVFKSKVGEKNVDFVHCLSGVELDVLEKVVGFLSADDLVRCSLVSRSWNSILEDNRLSRTKKSAFLSSRGQKNKENLLWPGELTVEKCLKRVRPSASSTPLATISSSRQLNFSHPAPSPISPSKIARVDRFNVYREAGNALKEGESQMCCPRCSLPARRNTSINLGVCTNGCCSFQFCLSCRSEHHTTSPCLLLRSPEKPSRSRKLTKKSYKRNMRRL